VRVHLKVADPGVAGKAPAEAPLGQADWPLPEPLSLPYIQLINRVYRWVLLPAIAFIATSGYSFWETQKLICYVSACQAGILLVVWATLRLRSDLTLQALRTGLYGLFGAFVFELSANYISIIPDGESSRIAGYLGLALFSLTVFIIGAHTVQSHSGARLASLLMWLISSLTASGGVALVAYQGHAIGGLMLTTASFILGGLVSFGMTMTFSHLYSMHSRLQAERSLLKRYALTDSLTGLPNRLAFETTLESDYTLALRTEQPLSLILFDLDRFKHVNDTYGHSRGDAVLAHVAQVLHSVIRGSDHPARWGGEEFVVVLPNSSAHDALVLAERLRKAIEKTNFAVGGLTVSLGVAQLREVDSPLSLVHRADEALYRAKAAGRNRVECDESDAVPRPPRREFDLSLDSDDDKSAMAGD
jgi:diguanylate cyclase (GGDEF)-like protein